MSVIHLAGNSAAVAGSPAYTNTTTGALAGSVHATDPDGDALGYAVDGLAGGQLILDPDGQFAFIPTNTQRLHAGNAWRDSETFGMNVSDSHNATTAVLVNVPVLPETADVADTISVNPPPTTVALTSSSFTADAVVGNNNTVAAIDTFNHTVITIISVGRSPGRGGRQRRRRSRLCREQLQLYGVGHLDRTERTFGSTPGRIEGHH